jgi:hypothetical protein
MDMNRHPPQVGSGVLVDVVEVVVVLQSQVVVEVVVVVVVMQIGLATTSLGKEHEVSVHSPSTPQ